MSLLGKIRYFFEYLICLEPQPHIYTFVPGDLNADNNCFMCYDEKRMEILYVSYMNPTYFDII